MNTNKEIKIFILSIAVTSLVATSGVIFGLLSGSQSILFDGIFSFIDMAMSVLSVIVLRLMASDTTRRFQFGFWHLEPLVATLNSAIILLLCFYAQLNAIDSLLKGGHKLDLGFATIYAILVCLVCFTMFFYERHLNKKLKSDLLTIDINGWLMAGLVTAALLVAFIVGLLIQNTRFNYLEVYIDSVALLVLTVLFIPIPIKSLKHSLSEIFLVTPLDIDYEINQIMEDIAAQYNFPNYISYLAKTGRLYSIEIHIVTPDDFAKGRGVIELDEIREQIKKRIPPELTNLWLTICFTSEERWIY